MIDHNKGGLIVNVHGVRGFVPLSQIVDLKRGSAPDEAIESRLATMHGRRLLLKVIEMNRRRNRLILSERAAVQERRQREKDRLLEELQEREKKKIALSLKRLQAEPWTRVAERYHIGQVVKGRITKLAPFGAFAEIDEGVEGLIHISELSEERVTHPKSVLKEGDEVLLRIIRIDAQRHRLGLSLRQAQEEEQESYPAVYTTQGPTGATLGEVAGLRHLPGRAETASEAGATEGAERPPTAGASAAEHDAGPNPSHRASVQA